MFYMVFYVIFWSYIVNVKLLKLSTLSLILYKKKTNTDNEEKIEKKSVIST